MYGKHPFGVFVALILWVGAAAFAIRGEMEAQSIKRGRREKLATFPARIVEIRAELTETNLSSEAREELERELRFCELGFTGTPSYFAYNARLAGYGIAVAVTLAGLVFLQYEPRRKRRPRQRSPR